MTRLRNLISTACWYLSGTSEARVTVRRTWGTESVWERFCTQHANYYGVHRRQTREVQR